MQHLCGWLNDQREVDRICQSLPVPIFNTPDPDPKLNVNLADIYTKVTGRQIGLDIQGIGDCTSFGWKHLIDITQCVEITQAQNDPKITLEEFQETASEVIYALERVEVGGQRGSYQDGGVGAWCAKSCTDYGTLSRPNLQLLGLPPAYDKNRAKQWGAQGLPSNLKPEALKHILQTTSLVRNFKEAAWHIQNGRPVAVCSNVGFENGRMGQTVRDGQGFARAAGTWAHCMCFIACRFDRPGLGILNQWPFESTSGPKGFPNDPDQNFWWVDENIVNHMLSQGDSFTGSVYSGYPVRNIWRI